MDWFWSTVPDIAIPIGFVLLHAYLWLRLFRDTTRPGSRWRPVGAVTVGVLGAFGMLAWFLTPSTYAPMWLQMQVGWPGWIWFGIMAYLSGALILAEPVRWLVLRRKKSPVPAVDSDKGDMSHGTDGQAESDDSDMSHGTGPADAGPTKPDGNDMSHGTGPTRRLVVARGIALGATAVALGTVGSGLYEGYRTPRLKSVAVALPKLARAFDGYRIAIIGDTHFSAIRGRGYCERVVDQINGTQPDLIAFVGDLASNEADQLRRETEPLAGLEARDGAFFVSGNAEHYVGADAWYDRVEELGMIGLPNKRVELAGFDLAGVNDLIVEQRDMQDTETGPDFEAALGDRDPARPVVLLAHQPTAVDRLAGYGVGLQLSGHTHGGQMWPVHYLSRLRSGQLTGLETHDGTQVYVTNGAGTNGPPLRIGADADITVMTLRAAN
jgi:predicted MPP superfamily phosphohydrolase